MLAFKQLFTFFNARFSIAGVEAKDPNMAENAQWQARWQSHKTFYGRNLFMFVIS
jgi:hypothetical protein